MQEEQPHQPPNDRPNAPPPIPEATDSGPTDRTASNQAHPSLTQKQRRIGERIIELGIFSIATVSIVAIFLIFFFVFKETAPIFFGSDEKKKPVAAATSESATTSSREDSSLASEVYGAADDSKPKENTSAAAKASDSDTATEVYNPSAEKIPSPGQTETTPTGNDEAEVYNPNAKDIPESGSTASVESTRTAPTAPINLTQTQRDSTARTIIGEDYPILDHDSPVELSHLFYEIWQPNSEHPRYGIYSILVGTLKTTLVALLIAAPLGILAALYSAFFAPKWMRETLKPAIELLAGFPSVVLGFFCLMTVATIVQTVFGTDFRLNSVVGGIGLALAVIPIIYTISDDALRAVPGSLREAALALGASEWQVAYKVMLPAATPGIFAAILLGVGRAFGETMIALMATGNAGTFSWNFFEPVRTFAATIGAEMGEVVVGSPHYQLLFLLGVILFIFSFAINLVTEFYIKDRLIKRFRGNA